MNVLVLNGKKAFKKYVLDIKAQNKLKGVYSKVSKKKNGWEKEYYYKKLDRDLAFEQGLTNVSKAMLIEQGYLPTDQLVRYYEQYLKTRPSGFEEDFLSDLKRKGKIKFEGNELITDEDTYEHILKVAGKYFKDLKKYNQIEM